MAFIFPRNASRLFVIVRFTIARRGRYDKEKGEVRIGVLIIGSLYWDCSSPRPDWRSKRLECARRQAVTAPIRYGRRSGSRGETYTMVFSPGLSADELGTAMAIPCRSHNLIEEAKWLWAAEVASEEGPTGDVSRSWGCVAVLENPDHRLPDEVREDWSARVSREPGYGNLIRVDGEDAVVDKSGVLKICWPRTVDGSPLEFNALLATANSPRGCRRGYPSPRQIADAWNTRDGRAEVGYFCKNRDNGITTHQDLDIDARLRELGLTQ